jgi:hypothetical protein
VNAQGGKLDIWDIVTLNAAMEWSYYVDQYDKAHKIASLPSVTAGDHCSAFVAIGSYTKDGRVVIAHNNWRAVDDGVRHSACARVSLCDGWAARADSQRG